MSNRKQYFATGGEKRKFFKNIREQGGNRGIAVAMFGLIPAFAPIAVVFLVFAGLALLSGSHLLTVPHVRMNGRSAMLTATFLAGAVTVPAARMTGRQPTKLPPIDPGDFLSKVTRDQGPEWENVTLPFINSSVQSNQVSLKTDRKIKVYDLHVRGRVTVGAGIVTFRAGPPLLNTPLFSLLGLVTIQGQYGRTGFTTPIQLRGETAAEMFALIYPNWTPQFSNSVNGGALTPSLALSGAANATNDFDFTLPIPTYPLGVSPGDQVLNCLHGPDWAGNLFLQVLCADPTAMGVTIASLANGGAVTAFGSAAGTGTIDILAERPFLTRDLMRRIKPSLCFRLFDSAQINVALQSGGTGAAQKIRDLTVGRDTLRIFVKVGTLQAGTSANVVAFSSLSDTMITRTSFKVDDRELRFLGANMDLVMKDMLGRSYGRNIPAGYRVIDFICGSGPGFDNLSAAFPSANLTADKKFQLVGDIATNAANQGGEVVQEMLLGKSQVA